MTGIMALVVEKAESRQGQANAVLYPLSQQAPQVFHDITVGTNRVSCVAGTPDCKTDGFLSGYSAAVGYDMATGLNSCNGFNFSFHRVPAGKYNVIVTATLGSDSHQTTIPVTVQ